MSSRTVLLGLDGATFYVLDDLMASGDMPFLKSFFESGVRAPLETIIPALTPPAWTSLMTGRTPGYHGIYDFFRMESAETRQIRFCTSHDLLCPTIWTIASEAGKRVSSMNYPSMFPAPKISGHVVPGWVPWRQMRMACWPDDLYGKLKEIPGLDAKELALDIKLEEKATEGCADRSELLPWIELHIRREQNWFRILEHLFHTDPSDLIAVLFDGVDKLQHLCWRFIKPADGQPLTEPWEFEIRERCLDYYRELDTILKKICDLAGPDATIVMASDHGFQATREVFNVNAWLEKKGYLTWSEAGKTWDTQGATLGVNSVARHTWMIDWEKTKAFAVTPTSNGVFIVTSDGSTPGVTPEEYPAFRDKLMADLATLKDPATGERIVAQIWPKDIAFKGATAGVPPDLTLVMRDGGLISILPSNEDVKTRDEIAGCHHPHGIFGARGPGIQKGASVDRLSILDIAPLVLHSLHLPVPGDMEGAVPEVIFQPEALQTHPVVKSAVTTDSHVGPATEAKPLDAEAEAVLMDRLRELGYIE